MRKPPHNSNNFLTSKRIFENFVTDDRVAHGFLYLVLQLVWSFVFLIQQRSIWSIRYSSQYHMIRGVQF